MTDKQKNHSLTVIGRFEMADLPAWNLQGLEAKIDTGAYTSSLHCHHIEYLEENEKTTVRFNLLDPTHEDYHEKMFEWPVHKIKKVRSSNGQSEQRIIVKTPLVLAGRKINAQLSLTDRSQMRYPILIGRKLLKNKFLVDVSIKFSTINT